MARAGFWAVESAPIRFGRDGRWYSGDDIIANPRIDALFSRHLRRAADGSFWLEIADERACVEIEDTPFVVRHVDPEPEGGFALLLNDGTREPLPAEGLELGSDGVLRCSIKNGLYQARFLRAAQIELLNEAQIVDNETFVPGPRGSRVLLKGPETS